MYVASTINARGKPCHLVGHTSCYRAALSGLTALCRCHTRQRHSGQCCNPSKTATDSLCGVTVRTWFAPVSPACPAPYSVVRNRSQRGVYPCRCRLTATRREQDQVRICASVQPAPTPVPTDSFVKRGDAPASAAAGTSHRQVQQNVVPSASHLYWQCWSPNNAQGAASRRVIFLASRSRAASPDLSECSIDFLLGVLFDARHRCSSAAAELRQAHACCWPYSRHR